MNRLLTRSALVTAGALLGGIGGALILVPQDFLSMSHVVIDSDPGLMFELAAPGGVLLISGALMLAGAVRIRFADLALAIGAIIYGSYGAGRLISMALHGLPSDSLIAATVIELGIAATLSALWLASPSRKQQGRNEDEFDGVVV
ncbi:DUF4345 domain-containing protein [Hyphobacterium sp.]|uniref:DUF4345 domain-containing protein n=1 Tax=Hyphobacterium sp. TaxID=2004662 RepID=UPI0037478E4E